MKFSSSIGIYIEKNHLQVCGFPMNRETPVIIPLSEDSSDTRIALSAIIEDDIAYVGDDTETFLLSKNIKPVQKPGLIDGLGTYSENHSVDYPPEVLLGVILRHVELAARNYLCKDIREVVVVSNPAFSVNQQIGIRAAIALSGIGDRYMNITMDKALQVFTDVVFGNTPKVTWPCVHIGLTYSALFKSTGQSQRTPILYHGVLCEPVRTYIEEKLTSENTSYFGLSESKKVAFLRECIKNAMASTSSPYFETLMHVNSEPYILRLGTNRILALLKEGLKVLIKKIGFQCRSYDGVLIHLEDKGFASLLECPLKELQETELLPRDAVAMGAAYIADVTEKEKFHPHDLKGASLFDFKLIFEGFRQRVLEKRSPLPARRVIILPAQAKQLSSELECKLVVSIAELDIDVDYATVRIRKNGFTQRWPKKLEIEVLFSITGELECKLADFRSNLTIETTIQESRPFLTKKHRFFEMVRDPALFASFR